MKSARKIPKSTPRALRDLSLKTILAAGLLLAALGAAPALQAQVTPEDGDWAAKQAALTNTPQAAFMARVGDIDNLSFGWPASFDPFSGGSTPAHAYPWTPDPADPGGTDRIMVVTSYANSPPCGQDGYTAFTLRPDNNVRPIVLSFALPALTVTNAVLQIFVDDFQAPVWCANYQVTLNGRRATFMEALINSLDQTGPVGKLITIGIPADFFNEVLTGRLEFRFDDPTTGAGDGYAIDFIKLLVNVKSLPSGGISGYVRDAVTSQPITGARVASVSVATSTGTDGFYTLTGVPAGLAFVQVSAAGYSPSNRMVDVIVGQTSTDENFALHRAPLTLFIERAVQLRFYGQTGVSYTLQYSSDFTGWTNDETIVGAGAEVVRWRLADAPHRYWQVLEN